MATHAEIDQAFQRSGIRRTPQRFEVLSYLVRRKVHATADEIFQALNRTDPKASRATVYNSLRALAESGLVREVALEGNAARFDANIHPHHHFVCDACGSVEDIEWFDVPARAAAPSLGRRTVRDTQVIFHGTCESCS
jgi:Fur family peroxide stress response transcriptional regulator